MILIALLLTFIAGILVGKGGKFYFYVDGELFDTYGRDRFIFHAPYTGIGLNLHGVDYTDGELSAVYRPSVKWVHQDGISAVDISTGDFQELLILVAPKFPFVKIKYLYDTSVARSIDE